MGRNEKMAWLLEVLVSKRTTVQIPRVHANAINPRSGGWGGLPVLSV